MHPIRVVVMGALFLHAPLGWRARPAHAADIIVGEDVGDRVKLQISKKSSRPASHKIQYSAKDVDILFTPGGDPTDDPPTNGATAVIFSETACQCITMAPAPVVSPGWIQTPTSGTPKTYKWKDNATRSTARVAAGKIQLKKKGDITYSLGAVPQGETEVQITFGNASTRFCTRFAAPSVMKDTETQYRAIVTKAGFGPACSAVPESCELCGATTTTSTTSAVTSTTSNTTSSTTIISTTTSTTTTSTTTTSTTTTSTTTSTTSSSSTTTSTTTSTSTTTTTLQACDGTQDSCPAGQTCMDNVCRRTCVDSAGCFAGECCSRAGLCVDRLCPGCDDDAAGTYAIDPEDYPVGAYGADTPEPTHWKNAAGRVLSQSNWTTAPAKYFAPDVNDTPTLKSVDASRDMEIDTWWRNGYVVLRHTTDGRGIIIEANLEVAGGQVCIGILTGETDTTRYGTAYYYLTGCVPISPRVSGYHDLPTDGDYLTFGVSGFDIYAKWNGQEFIRIQEYRHMDPGVATIKTLGAYGYGIRRTAIRHLPRKCLYSDYANNSLDLRDFGLRSTRAVGDIDEGSNQLILHAMPSEPFRKGDPIIVELGGEAGGGLRGTVGVGGTWPALHYPDASAMQFDTARPEGTYAWLETDATVHQWWQGTWYAMPASSYYPYKAIPLALRATVTDVSSDGQVVTLDRAATTSSIGAILHFDNAPTLQRLVVIPNGGLVPGQDLTPITPTDLDLRIPSGEYALGKRVVMYDHPGWKITGAGESQTKLFSPRGVPSAQLSVGESPNAVVRQLELQGNARNDGFGLAFGTESVTETSLDPLDYRPLGLAFSASPDSRVTDVTVTDCFQSLVTSYSDNLFAERVKSVMTEGKRTYVQWMFQWKDSVGGGCIDCSVTSPTLLGGFESFKSYGTLFRRCTGTNATMAFNSAGGYTVEDTSVVVKAGSNDGNAWFSPFDPMINVNTNINSGAQYYQYGGTVRNVTLIQEGFISLVGPNHDSLRGISINYYNPNVTVIGGSYSAPDYTSPTQMVGAVGMNSTGLNTVVDGFAATGQTDGYYGNINVGWGIVRNCVADSIRYSEPYVTIENNQVQQLIPYQGDPHL